MYEQQLCNNFGHDCDNSSIDVPEDLTLKYLYFSELGIELLDQAFECSKLYIVNLVKLILL